MTLGKDYASVGAQKKIQKQEPDVNKEMSAAGGRNGVTIMSYYMEKPIITGERKKKKKKENERDVFVEENKNRFDVGGNRVPVQTNRRFFKFF